MLKKLLNNFYYNFKEHHENVSETLVLQFPSCDAHMNELERVQRRRWGVSVIQWGSSTFDLVGPRTVWMGDKKGKYGILEKKKIELNTYSPIM